MAHGAVIIFPDHLSKKDCDAILARMFKSNEINGSIDWTTRKAAAPTAKNFNPDMGGPVWYIP